MKTKFIKNLCLALFGLIIMSSCGGKQTENTIAETGPDADIEVIYFYGKQRCSSCVAMEKYAKEAIDSMFSEKVKDGVIAFKTIDITTPEGEKVADLFEVTSSSLFIVDHTPDKTEKVNMTAFGFRNARNNRQAYKQGIIDQINKFLD